MFRQLTRNVKSKKFNPKLPSRELSYKSFSIKPFENETKVNRFTRKEINRIPKTDSKFNSSIKSDRHENKLVTEWDKNYILQQQDSYYNKSLDLSLNAFNSTWPFRIPKCNQKEMIWLMRPNENKDKHTLDIASIIIHPVTNKTKNVKFYDLSHNLIAKAFPNYVKVPPILGIAWVSQNNRRELYRFLNENVSETELPENLNIPPNQMQMSGKTLLINTLRHLKFPEYFIDSRNLAYPVYEDLSENSNFIHVPKVTTKFYGSLSSFDDESKLFEWTELDINENCENDIIAAISEQTTTVKSKYQNFVDIQNFSQYDITLSEKVDYEYEKTYFLDFDYITKRTDDKKTKILTWDIYSHNEYGYSPILNESRHLYGESSIPPFQKNIASELPNTSKDFKRIYKTRFDIFRNQETLDPILNPLFRVPNIIHRIKSSDSDLLTLQNVDYEIFSKYKCNFQEFGMNFTQKINTTGLLIMWNKEKYNLIESCNIDVNMNPNLNNFVYWIDNKEYHKSLKDESPNISPLNIVILQNSKSSEKIILANIEIRDCNVNEWINGPNKPDQNDTSDESSECQTSVSPYEHEFTFFQNIYQMLKSLYEIEQIAYNYSTSNIILSGNFNCNLNNKNDFLYSILTKGSYKFSEEQIEEIISSKNLESDLLIKMFNDGITSSVDRKYSLISDDSEIFTKFTFYEKRRTDGIFISKGQGEMFNYISADEEMPNIDIPSNHLLQVGEVEF